MEEQNKKKAIPGWRKAERRYKIGNIIGVALIAAAYFNYIQFSTAIPAITIMIAYICFANQVGDEDGGTNRVIILAGLVALLSITYFSHQNTKKENRERLDSTSTQIINYCESKLNSSTNIESSSNISKDNLIDCGILEETLNTLKVNNYDSDYDDYYDDDGELFGLF